MFVTTTKRSWRRLRTIWPRKGINILKANDGEEALKILKAQHVDLLVIDVMMPKLDGIRQH